MRVGEYAHLRLAKVVDDAVGKATQREPACATAPGSAEPRELGKQGSCSLELRDEAVRQLCTPFPLIEQPALDQFALRLGRELDLRERACLARKMASSTGMS
jgi:hypothetical protein